MFFFVWIFILFINTSKETLSAILHCDALNRKPDVHALVLVLCFFAFEQALLLMQNLEACRYGHHTALAQIEHCLRARWNHQQGMIGLPHEFLKNQDLRCQLRMPKNIHAIVVVFLEKRNPSTLLPVNIGGWSIPLEDCSSSYTSKSIPEFIFEAINKFSALLFTLATSILISVCHYLLHRTLFVKSTGNCVNEVNKLRI